MTEIHGGLTRDQVQAMFERRKRAYDELDAAALAADYAAGAVIESPMGGTHVGPAAAEEFFRSFFDALEPKFTTEALLIDGDRVAWVCRFEGTNLGGFLGLPPSGKHFAVPVVVVCDLQDGKIVRDRRIYDFTGVLVQLGVLKAKPV